MFGCKDNLFLWNMSKMWEENKMMSAEEIHKEINQRLQNNRWLINNLEAKNEELQLLLNIIEGKSDFG